MTSLTPVDPAGDTEDPRGALEIAIARLRRSIAPIEDSPTVVLHADRGRVRTTPRPRPGAWSTRVNPAAAQDVRPTLITDDAGAITFASISASSLVRGDTNSALVGTTLDRLFVPIGVPENAGFASLLAQIDETAITIEVSVRDAPDPVRHRVVVERIRSVLNVDTFVLTVYPDAPVATQPSLDEVTLLRCLADIGEAAVDEATLDRFLRRIVRSLRIASDTSGLRISTKLLGGGDDAWSSARPLTVVDSREPQDAPAMKTRDATLRFESVLCTIEVLGDAPTESACQLLDRVGRRLSSAIAKRWAEEQLVEVAAQFTVLDTISAEFASRSQSIDHLLQTVAKRLGHRRGTASIVELWDSDQRHPEQVVVCGGDPDTNELLMKVADEVVLADEAPLSTSSDLQRFLRNAGIDVSSIVSSPIRGAGDVLGALHVVSLEDDDGAGDRYSDMFLRVIGDRLGIAVENSRLEAKNVEHVDQLEVRVRERTRELAAALEGLRHAQTELVRAERLSSLGAMVAGVAHELNTPIGSAVLVTSTLTSKVEALRRSLESGPLRRSEFQNFLDDCSVATELLGRCLGSANQLIGSFKQVGIDQTGEQRRDYDLATTVGHVVDTLIPSLRHLPHTVDLVVHATTKMNGFPGALGRIVSNLVRNASIHGFEPGQDGTVRIEVGQLPNGWACIDVVDDGVGIPDEDVGRLFDPFFTTKLGSGGSGLGLHIVFTLATKVLGGRVSVETLRGRGSRFHVEIPTVAPHRSQPPGGPT